MIFDTGSFEASDALCVPRAQQLCTSSDDGPFAMC